VRVAFLGNDRWSVAALEALAASTHEVVGVVTAGPKPAGRGNELTPTPVADAARALGLPLAEVDTVKTGPGFKALATTAPEVLAVVAYGELLPPNVLHVPSTAPVNLHFSLLPELRGASPVQTALLLGLDALDVRLQMHGEVLDVDRVALDHAWTGDYLALWPAPAALELAPGALPVNAFATGASGPVIDWVAAQLQPRYLAASGAPARVDATLREAVRSYQRARGLASDGVIGPETLMALSSRDAGARLLLALE